MQRFELVKVSVCLLFASVIWNAIVGTDAIAAQLRRSQVIDDKDRNASLHIAWRNASRALKESPEVTLKHWGRYRRSIDESSPMVRYMWYELAEKAYRALDRYSQSGEMALHLIEIAESLSSAHRGKAFNLLGISLRHLYAYPMSATSYRCAIAHYPDDHRKLASVYNNLAIVQQRLGRLDSSISLFQQAIRTGQQHFDTPQNTYLINLSITSARAGRHEKAVYYLKQAMFLETADVNDERRLKALTYLLFSLTELKDWIQVDRIAKEVERRSTLATDSSTYLLYQWVQVYYQFQRYHQRPSKNTINKLLEKYAHTGISGADFIYEQVAKALTLTMSKTAKPKPKLLTLSLKQRVEPALESCGK